MKSEAADGFLAQAMACTRPNCSFWMTYLIGVPPISIAEGIDDFFGHMPHHDDNLFKAEIGSIFKAVFDQGLPRKGHHALVSSSV